MKKPKNCSLKTSNETTTYADKILINHSDMILSISEDSFTSFLKNSPLKTVQLTISRNKDTPRNIEISSV
ncbi:MAG: hypothetical protein RLZZ422_2315 [Pseudomonadota bacterium]|jgi:hypothetical protein